MRMERRSGFFLSRSRNDVSNVQCDPGAVLGMVKHQERGYIRWEMIHLSREPPAIISSSSTSLDISSLLILMVGEQLPIFLERQRLPGREL